MAQAVDERRGRTAVPIGLEAHGDALVSGKLVPRSRTHCRRSQSPRRGRGVDQLNDADLTANAARAGWRWLGGETPLFVRSLVQRGDSVGSPGECAGADAVRVRAMVRRRSRPQRRGIGRHRERDALPAGALLLTTSASARYGKAKADPSPVSRGGRITITPTSPIQVICTLPSTVWTQSPNGLVPAGLLSQDGTWQSRANGSTNRSAGVPAFPDGWRPVL